MGSVVSVVALEEEVSEVSKININVTTGSKNVLIKTLKPVHENTKPPKSQESSREREIKNIHGNLVHEKLAVSKSPKSPKSPKCLDIGKNYQRHGIWMDIFTIVKRHFDKEKLNQLLTYSNFYPVLYYNSKVFG